MKTTATRIALAVLCSLPALAASGLAGANGIPGSTIVPLISAGAPPDTPAARIDPNVPSSPFSGVVSINIRYPDPQTGRPLSFICSGALISPRHVLSAGHCVDTTGNGNVIDVSQPFSTSGRDVRVVFNGVTGPNSIQVITATDVVMNPFYQGFGHCPSGVPGFCVNDDISIITLGQDAPAGARIYPVVPSPGFTGLQTTMVGYGTSGDGINGYTVSPNFFIRRVGGNVQDLFDLDDEQNFGGPPLEVWYADFDGVLNGVLQDTFCTLFSVCTPILPNNVETNLGGGDSGGPSFIVSNGNLWLVANNTFGGTIDENQVDGTFGTFMGGILLYSYLPFIEQATGGLVQVAPEPESYALLMLGLGALAVSLRRRRK